MGSEKRQPDTALKDRLTGEFYRFSFFKAVSLIEHLFPDKKPLGRTLSPAEESVHFSSKPGLTFPASDISKIEHPDEKRPVDMEVTFMGLIGPSGVLPHCYNEQVIERLMQKDRGLKAFYDMFHHRLISLFYLAWKKHRLAENYLSGAKDRYSSYVLSLTGMGTPGLAELAGLPDRSLLYFFCGLLSKGSTSVSAIEAVLAYFSGTTVRIEEFVERLLPISPEDRTRIGTANGLLGVDTVCGSHVHDCGSKFRAVLGPMRYKDYIRFLPDGEMLKPVFFLIRYMAGIEYEFDVRIILKREEVPACAIGTGHPLLGETTWVKSPGVVHDHDPFAVFQEADA